MYALVLIEYAVKTLDKTFVYEVPERYQKEIKVGMKVKVYFGAQLLNGFVLKLSNEYNNEYELKQIEQLVDKEIVLNEELLSIAAYLKEKTLCTYISAIETMLPPSLKVKNHKSNYNSFDIYLRLKEDKKIGKNSLVQEKIVEDIKKFGQVLKKNYSVSSVKSLLEKGIVEEIKVAKYRINVEKKDYVDKVLTEEQREVFEKIKKSFFEKKVFLLYGVTGSGKTEVYLKLIEEVLKSGKTAILLVPEITLTAQITKRFYAKFGSDVAILHSALSIGEKHDEYKKIMQDEVKLVIGTRSAIFAPLKNLGLIIIDEEHSSSYKQDNNPRYNAKDIALKRCEINNIPLVLGSATPLLETKIRADKKVYELVKLTKRVGKAVLPKIHIVDMVAEMQKRNMVFSDLLKEKIKDRLEKKEQTILLLNRRGHSTYINCSNCGYVYKCPNCDISLTYHKTTHNLICHYCGYLVKKASFCPNCKEDALNYFGLGTEKLEEQLITLFPEARIIRMDQDTTTKKGSHEKIVSDFQDEKYDILLGTQMISKGLDFPKVSLVGVINADTSLNIPDFRSNELTYALLSQVAGRAGRKDIKGEVIIQTFNPDNYVINCVKNNDYESFFEQEMDIRRALRYPPYYYLISIKIIGLDYEITLNEAKKVKKYLMYEKNKETLVLGPTTAAILRFNNEYRFQIIIKYRFDENIIKKVKEIDEMYLNNKNIR
ncbi:MAG: primosomal protein N', partial [Firmicutes bacterium]|nr:primosomal protein N' [Bacillota bacterium]